MSGDGRDPQTLAEETLRLAEEATPAPWLMDGPFWVDPPGDSTGRHVETRAGVTGKDRALVMPGAWGTRDADAEFIAHARTAAPALARAVQDLTAEVKRWKSAAEDHLATAERRGNAMMELQSRLSLTDQGGDDVQCRTSGAEEADQEDANLRRGLDEHAARVAAEATTQPDEVCSTCGGTGRVMWEPFAHRDSDEDEQPCPDCPEGRRHAVEIGRVPAPRVPGVNATLAADTDEAGER